MKSRNIWDDADISHEFSGLAAHRRAIIAMLANDWRDSLHGSACVGGLLLGAVRIPLLSHSSPGTGPLG